MKIAVVQLNSGLVKADNIARAVYWVKQAILEKAKAVFLPELFNYRGPLNKKQIMEVAESIPGPSLVPLIELARKNRVFILAGSIYEKASTDTKCYNTSVFINDYGRVSACYRKMNLFDAVVNDQVIKESRFFLKGHSLGIATLDSFKMGMSICYDLRFSGMYNKYSKKHCGVMAVPSNFTQQTGEAHWEVLLRARAIENLSYVIAPNQCAASAGGVQAFGNSMIIDPWGRVLARAGAQNDEIIFARLQKEALEYCRAILPSMIH